MFSHVMVGSNDIEASKRFYDAVLGVLGAKEGFLTQSDTGIKRVFYRHNGSAFGVGEPLNGEPATYANGGTIGFTCDSEEQVNKFHELALEMGGVSIENPPGMREGAMGKMYLAYVRDPDGNKLCAIYRPA